MIQNNYIYSSDDIDEDEDDEETEENNSANNPNKSSKNNSPGNFANDREKASAAGQKGGRN